MIDLRKIKKLIELVEESKIESLKISENGETIEISKPAFSMAMTTAPLPVVHTAASPPIPVPLEPAHKSTVSTETRASLNSPMVGTVYLSSAPGAAPFVEVGQQVKIGQVICLIEAMKMYNQIEADKAGVIVTRVIENGAPVEFGQPLFIIE